MSNETTSKVFKLKCIEPETFKQEGIIERGSLDAKELLGTGRYEHVGAHPGKIAKPSNGTPVVADVAPDPVEDGDAKVKAVQSMNGAALEAFNKKEGLGVKLKGLNLVKQRAAIIEALGAVSEDEDEDDNDL